MIWIAARWSEVEMGIANGEQEKILLARTLTSKSLLAQCLEVKELRSKIEEVLGEDALKQIDQDRQSAEDRMVRRLLHRLLIVDLERNCEVALTYKQFMQLVDLISSKVETREHEVFALRYYDACLLPNEDFQSVLTEEQWEKAKTLIEQFRTLAMRNLSSN